MKKDTLCRYNLELKDDKEVYEFLRTLFPDLDIKDVKGSYLSFCISLLCYICYPLSISEITTTLGTYIGGSIGRTRFGDMVSRGDLKKYEFDKEKDMNALYAYYLSSTRKESLQSMLPDFFKDADTKFRKTAGKVPVHDYGCGMSLMQIMLLKRPFTFQKEVGFTSSSRYKKEKGSLCVDAVVCMKDNGERYYIEQDMGTERISTLCGKLYSYEKYALYRDRGALIFSCHVVMPYSKRECYNKTQLSFLYEDMKEEMFDDIYDYYECSKDMLEEKKLVALKDLMITVGAAINSDSVAGGGGAITAATEIKRSVEGGRFSLSDFDNFIKTLSAGTNEYRIREYNKEQIRKATHKFRSMSELLCAYVRKGGVNRGEIRFITTAFPCMVYPTVLLSHCFDYLKEEYYKKKEMEKVLDKYFDDIKDCAYQKSGLSVYVEDECTIYLNNTYISKSGRIICVEPIGCDLSAFVRFYYLYYLRDFITQPLYLVGTGSRDDIVYMAKQFNYFLPYGSTLPETGLFISFIDEDYPDSLLVPFRREDGDVILVDLVSDTEEKRRKKLMDAYNKLPPEVRASMSKEEKAKALGLI